MVDYVERTYRNYSGTEGLVSFIVTNNETDLFISARQDLGTRAADAVELARSIINRQIDLNPQFQHSLKPLSLEQDVPDMIQKMLQAGIDTGVGPMAAVAGAVAEFTGNELLAFSDEVIVENGGDVFYKMNRPVTISIFAGSSPLSERIGLRLPSEPVPVALCTSSGRIGHSLSFGSADAVTIKSHSACLADAAATAIGNEVKSDADIASAIDKAGAINGVLGVLIIRGEHIGIWGDLELLKL
ncbi:MAG: UPF0280 family protein [Deltaproteobacteria bacterium]|nr:UPF0280 family protein [Deltaproteobacteria bacterium]